MSDLGQEFGGIEVKNFQWSLTEFKSSPLENNNLYNIQQLSNLCEDCVLQNFTQVVFYVSRNFPKLSSIQIFYLTRRKNYKSMLWNVQ